MRRIQKQPNGLYAVWSSIVDSFIMLDASPADIIEHLVSEARREITDNVNREIARIDAGLPAYVGYLGPHKFAESVARLIEMENHAMLNELRERGLLIEGEKDMMILENIKT